ncbi:zf-HC2 domain-containing protein [bacterium]|nr:zf-HC2 domain-containing protein [bacterium]
MAGHDQRLCERMRALLPGLLAGDVEGREERALLGHLEVCYDCREERRLLSNAFEALRSLPESERSRLREAALSEMALEEPSPRGRFAGAVLVFALAILFVIALVGAKVVHRAPAPERGVGNAKTRRARPATPSFFFGTFFAPLRLCVLSRGRDGRPC